MSQRNENGVVGRDTVTQPKGLEKSVKDEPLSSKTFKQLGMLACGEEVE